MMFQRRKKSVSALIATILLIVVAVALIAIILTWGKSFSNSNLSTVSNISDSKDFQGMVWYSKSLNNNVFISNKTHDRNLVIVGYKINSIDYNGFWLNSIHYLSSPVTVQPNSTSNIEVICLPVKPSTIDLLTDKNNYVSINVVPSNHGYSSCDVYDVPLFSFQEGTGDYTINEYSIQQGELVTNGSFDTDTNWTKDIEWTISNGVATYNGSINSKNIRQVGYITIGKMYKVSFSIITNGQANIRFGDISGNTIFNHLPTYPTGEYVLYLTSIRSSGVISVWGFNTVNSVNFQTGTAFSIDNLSILEIPPLPIFINGTNYLENVTAGTTAIQSKQAYGTWEFDVYKQNTTNSFSVHFLSDRIGSYSSVQGYLFAFQSDEAISIYKSNIGSGPSLFITAISYLSNNTWYRLKVARLQSAGVFTDIPTLQTNFSNSTQYPYTSFTSNGQYGFSAISNGSDIMLCGTNATISIISGGKYLVQFNLKMNSGNYPNIGFRNGFAGASYSNTVKPVSGVNNIILTASATGAVMLRFDNITSISNYEVSGLAIRRIYDANTFAVFIKGGAFGNNYTLVSTAGGSGTNPVTDSTYTSSNYFVLDMDPGDRFANFKMYNYIKED